MVEKARQREEALDASAGLPLHIFGGQLMGWLAQIGEHMHEEDPPLKRVSTQQDCLSSNPMDLNSHRRRPGDRSLRVAKKPIRKHCLCDPCYPYSIRDPWGGFILTAHVANGIPNPSSQVDVCLEIPPFFC